MFPAGSLTKRRKSAGGLRPTATSNPCSIASGGGGLPGTSTSTGSDFRHSARTYKASAEDSSR